jgi:hypothetical protein
MAEGTLLHVLSWMFGTRSENHTKVIKKIRGLLS